jgi:hypothetical protein
MDRTSEGLRKFVGWRRLYYLRFNPLKYHYWTWKFIFSSNVRSCLNSSPLSVFHNFIILHHHRVTNWEKRILFSICACFLHGIIQISYSEQWRIPIQTSVPAGAYPVVPFTHPFCRPELRVRIRHRRWSDSSVRNTRMSHRRHVVYHSSKYFCKRFVFCKGISFM